MKKIAKLIVVLFVVGICYPVYAVDFNQLLGTWDMTIEWTWSLDNEQHYGHPTWSFTEATEDSAVGYDHTNKAIYATWNATIGQFKIFYLDSPTAYHVMVFGDEIIGEWAGEDVSSALLTMTTGKATGTRSLQGPYKYYIPYFVAGDGFWTGLGLTNRSQEVSTNLQITVYGVGGDLLATENKTIPAHGQDSFVVATHLDNNGWVQVNSNQPMSGLAFLGSWGTPLLMADIPFSSDLSTCMIVPHVAQDSSWDTTILICNPNNETIDVTLKYVDKVGVEQGTQNYTILASGSGEYLLSAVFSDKIPLAGSIEISSSKGIAAFALYSDRKNGGTYYAGINAESCD